jgi:hypothetical protein
VYLRFYAIPGFHIVIRSHILAFFPEGFAEEDRECRAAKAFAKSSANFFSPASTPLQELADS